MEAIMKRSTINSVIYTIPNDLAIYYGEFDTKEAADERCENLNKKWEEYFRKQK